jgi:iron complex outermembrane receptor protein
LGGTLSVRFKKLTLTGNAYGAVGQMIYFTPLMAVIKTQGIINGNNIGLSLYQSPVKESLGNPAQSPSSRFIYKGNYLKMANLTLSYNVGKIKRIAKDLNIGLTGQNLFIITKYPGFSPETNYDAGINGIPSLGIDAAHYPSSRIISLSINFSI